MTQAEQPQQAVTSCDHCNSRFWWEELDGWVCAMCGRVWEPKQKPEPAPMPLVPGRALAGRGAA